MRIRALTLRILRQFLKDRRTLALMLVAPLLVLTLMKLVFDGQSVDPRIGTVRLPAGITAALQDAGAEVVDYESSAKAMAEMEDEQLDAVIALEGMKPKIVLEGSDPGTSSKVMATAQKALQKLVPSGAVPQPEVSYLHGSGDMDIFDYYGSVLVGFFSFFFVFIIAGVSFLRERTTGTLQKLLSTPLRRWEVVVGYLIGFGLFTLLQATLIAWYATSVLGIALEGSLILVLLMNLLLAITALTLGTLMSAYAQNEFQIFQFIPLVVVPQIFFCGLVDLDSMPEWLQTVGQALPLYYGADALRGIMLRGEGWDKIWLDAVVLIGFSAVFAALNILALRKHRRI